MTVLFWTLKDVWFLEHWFKYSGLSVTLISKMKENYMVIRFRFQFDKRFISLVLRLEHMCFPPPPPQLIREGTIFRVPWDVIRLGMFHFLEINVIKVLREQMLVFCPSSIWRHREGTNEEQLYPSSDVNCALPQTPHSSKTWEISNHPQLPILRYFATATRMLI